MFIVAEYAALMKFDHAFGQVKHGISTALAKK